MMIYKKSIAFMLAVVLIIALNDFMEPSSSGQRGSTVLESDTSDNFVVSTNYTEKSSLSSPLSSDESESFMTHLSENSSLKADTFHLRGEKQQVKNKLEKRKQLTGRAALDIARKASRSGDWELFLEAARKVREMPDYLHPMTLTAAIKENAPVSVFRTLIDEGEVFLPQHLTRISIEDNLPLLRELMPLGLNIHMELPNGDNAIHALLRTFNSLKTFEFLLQNNVVIKPSAKGIKPLEVALIGAQERLDAASHVVLLVKHGAVIDTEQLQLTHELASLNPQSYALIKANAPELIQ